VVMLPFMVAVQETNARPGRVTGGALALILRRHAPRLVVWVPVVRVLVPVWVYQLTASV
jgi:Mn2+/Fe2+ NRAMP family transporter